MNEYKRLHELFDITDSSTSIIHALSLKEDIPFLTSDNEEECSLDYYLGHSGNKKISPLVNKLLENDESTYIATLCDIIYNKFINKWTHIYSALEMEYNPIENYDMEQEEKRDSDLHTTTEVKSSETGSYGFNSEQSVPNTTAEGET